MKFALINFKHGCVNRSTMVPIKMRFTRWKYVVALQRNSENEDAQISSLVKELSGRVYSQYFKASQSMAFLWKDVQSW